MDQAWFDDGSIEDQRVWTHETEVLGRDVGRLFDVGAMLFGAGVKE